MIKNNKQEISYPTEWTYTIIGKDAQAMEKAVNTIIQPGTFSIKKSNSSSKGTYISLNVKLIVFSHDEQERYFRELGNHEEIKFVL
ncbi:hypothetical protein CHISP_0770 [Chitinispirillum alkaliphilum]|nr:hypothetical protein CHISP_0770 [Chitinispirillum alkaliphilum]